jgi:hypothetical protein
MGELHNADQTVEDLVATVREQHLMLLRAQDREIGLEQQLNTLKAGHNREDLVREIASLRASASFKIGRFLTAPFRFIGFLWALGARLFRAVGWRLRAKLRQR